MNIKDLNKLNLENGTYQLLNDSLVKANYKTGYFVAIIEYHKKETINNNFLIGVWTDTETGKTWVDKTVWMKDYKSAIKAAKHFGQIAIWDIKNNAEVRL